MVVSASWSVHSMYFTALIILIKTFLLPISYLPAISLRKEAWRLTKQQNNWNILVVKCLYWDGTYLFFFDTFIHSHRIFHIFRSPYMYSTTSNFVKLFCFSSSIIRFTWQKRNEVQWYPCRKFVINIEYLSAKTRFPGCNWRISQCSTKAASEDDPGYKSDVNRSVPFEVTQITPLTVWQLL